MHAYMHTCIRNSYAMAKEGLWNITVQILREKPRDKGGDIP